MRQPQQIGIAGKAHKEGRAAMQCGLTRVAACFDIKANAMQAKAEQLNKRQMKEEMEEDGKGIAMFARTIDP